MQGAQALEEVEILDGEELLAMEQDLADHGAAAAAVAYERIGENPAFAARWSSPRIVRSLNLYHRLAATTGRNRAPP